MRKIRKTILWGLYLLAFTIPLLASGPKISSLSMFPSLLERSASVSEKSHLGDGQNFIVQTAQEFSTAEWDVKEVDDSVALVVGE